MNSKYCSVGEVAAILGVSPSSVYWWISSNKYFSVRRLGRKIMIPRAQVNYYAKYGFEKTAPKYKGRLTGT